MKISMSGSGLEGYKIMDEDTYKKIEKFMLEMMKDSAHDILHIYRVMYQAFRIAKKYDEVNKRILIASCLLHDIGRDIQFQNPLQCHAVEGGKMAYTFLKRLGWEESDCRHVQDCITTHRFRTNNSPKTIEAKILFDSDKLDVTGALGIARSLLYKGQVGEPLYTVDENFNIHDGRNPGAPESFLKECHFKLLKLCNHFYTPEATIIAQGRCEFMQTFFEELVEEITIEKAEQLWYMGDE